MHTQYLTYLDLCDNLKVISLKGTLDRSWLAKIDAALYNLACLLQDLRAEHNTSPLDSGGSTADSYSSESTLSTSSKDESLSNIDLQDSGKANTVRASG